MVFRDNTAAAWGTLPLPDIVKNGLIQDPIAVGQQLKTLFTSAKIPADRIICSLSGLPFSYRLFNLPDMDGTSLEEAITRTAKQEMPLDPEDMILSWRSYPAEKEGERQFLVTGVTRRPIDALIKAFTSAGIKPYLMCLPHTALASLTEKDNAIIIDFDPDYANIIVVVRGVPVGMHTVPSSGADASLQETTVQLVRVLSRMTGFYNDNHPKNPIPDTTPILLTGELANEPEVAGYLKEKTGYPVETPSELTVNKLVIPADVPQSVYAVNISAALRDRTLPWSPAADVNLVRDINLAGIIASQSASAKKHEGLGKKWILTAVIAVGVLSLVTAFLSQIQAESKIRLLTTELQQAKEILGEKQASAVLAAKTEDTIRKLTASTQQWQTETQKILNPRDTVSDLNLLTQSMPPATTFDSIDVTTVKISISGITTVQERVVEYVRALEQSEVFTSVSIIWIDRASNKDMGISFLIVIER